MPYEIPQNLKYTEKIVFGMSFWQLFWICLFGGMAGIIFFKLPLNFYLKAVLSIVLMALGAGFAFFGFWEHLNTYRGYRKGIKEAGFFDKRLRNFTEIKKIENDAIYLNNGALRAVLEVTPINFGILSGSEQKAVISAYMDFLNSLDFPVQIIMRTVALNIDDYLFDMRKNVYKLNNAELEKQFESFKEFVQNFINENSVKNRLFYVIVPYSPYSKTLPLKDFITGIKNLVSKEKEQSSFQLNKEISLNQLNVRAELCTEKLKRCGLFVKRLNNEKILSVMGSFFDSYIETENDYFSPMTMLEKFSGEDGND